MRLCLAVSLGLLAPISAAFCDQPDIRVPVHTRLLTPLASYSKPGALFEAKVMGTFDADVPSPLPPGSILRGVVSQAASIGFGVKRERASLEITVTECRLPDGVPVSCEAVLSQIDNARESVGRNGRIQGVLAAGHPHSWLGGVWYRPAAAWSGRSFSGLTGAGGKLQSILAPSPLGAAIVVASRLIIFSLPDAEIVLPAGTDLLFHLEADNTEEYMAEDQPSLELPAEFSTWLKAAPVEVTQPDGRAAADIINLTFVGTKQQLAKAFRSAGWSTADPLTTKTFARSYSAAAGMRSYATAPVSPLLYDGRLPDAVFQKSLNSMAKRHHIRLWRVNSPLGMVWLGAGTHDISIGFEWRSLSLTHRIDPNIDIERQKTVYDLHSVGCLDAHSRVERPERASKTDSAVIATDGAVLVGRLKDCAPVQGMRTLKRPKRAFTTVIVRRFVLEGRHYMTRGNAYYWAYRGVKWSLSPKKQAAPSKIRSGAEEIVKVMLNPVTEGTPPASGSRPSS